MIATGAIASALLASGRAEAANCATLTFGANPTISGWDPLSGSAGSGSFTVTVGTLQASGASQYRLIFLDNQTASPIQLGTGGPKYRVTIGATDYAFPSNAAITSVPFNSGTSLTFNVAVLSNTGPVVDYIGGTVFSEPLNYTLQCYNGGGATRGSPDTGAARTVSLTIPKELSITSAGPYNINFGSFTTTTSNTSIGIKSTSSVDVAVTTVNGSQMVLAGAQQPYPTNSTIPYTMTLNGTTIASGPSTNLTRAGSAGASWPLVLTLPTGLPTGKLAGGYSDTITLTLTPGV